jgi:hypothetical protein
MHKNELGLYQAKPFQSKYHGKIEVREGSDTTTPRLWILSEETDYTNRAANLHLSVEEAKQLHDRLGQMINQLEKRQVIEEPDGCIEIHSWNYPSTLSTLSLEKVVSSFVKSIQKRYRKTVYYDHEFVNKDKTVFRALCNMGEEEDDDFITLFLDIRLVDRPSMGSYGVPFTLSVWECTARTYDHHNLIDYNRQEEE